MPWNAPRARVVVDQDRLAHLLERRIGDVERPEDRRVGGPFSGLLVDHLHQHRQPERVGQQDELLALVVAFVTHGCEEVDPGEPFLTRHPDLLGERV